ncbi:unnamed protein product, partial [Nesidiocoris tenuis]
SRINDTSTGLTGIAAWYILTSSEPVWIEDVKKLTMRILELALNRNTRIPVGQAFENHDVLQKRPKPLFHEFQSRPSPNPRELQNCVVSCKPGHLQNAKFLKNVNLKNYVLRLQDCGHPPAGSLWPHRDLWRPAVSVPEGLARIDRLRHSALLKLPRRTYPELTDSGLWRFRSYDPDDPNVDSSPNLRPFISSPLHSEWVSRCLKGEKCAKESQDLTNIENGESDNPGLTRGSEPPPGDELEEIVQQQGAGGVQEIQTESQRQIDEDDVNSEHEHFSDKFGSPIEANERSSENNHWDEQADQNVSEPIAIIQNEPPVIGAQPVNFPSVDDSGTLMKSSANQTMISKNESWDDAHNEDPVTKYSEISSSETFRDSTESEDVPEGKPLDLPAPGSTNTMDSAALSNESEKLSSFQIDQDDIGYNQPTLPKEENIKEPDDPVLQARIETSLDKLSEEKSKNILLNGKSGPSATTAIDSLQSNLSSIPTQPNHKTGFMPSDGIARNEIHNKAGVSPQDTANEGTSKKSVSKGIISPVGEMLKIPIYITDLVPEPDHVASSTPQTPILRQNGKPSEKTREPIVISLNFLRNADLTGNTAPDVLNNPSPISRVKDQSSRSYPVTIHVQPITHHHYYPPYLSPQSVDGIDRLPKSDLKTARQTRYSIPLGADSNSHAESFTVEPQLSTSISESGPNPETIDAGGELESNDELALELENSEHQKQNSIDKRQSFYRSENDQRVESQVISTSYPEESGALNTFSQPSTGEQIKLPTENNTDANAIYVFVGGQWFVNFKEPPEIFRGDGKPQLAFQPASGLAIAAQPGPAARNFQNTAFQPTGNALPLYARQPIYSKDYIMPFYGAPKFPLPNSHHGPFTPARSSDYPSSDGGPLQVIDLPADEDMNNRWMFNYPSQFPPAETPSGVSYYYSSPDSSYPIHDKPGEPLLNFDDSLVNFPKNDHASPTRDDSVNEEKMTPELFKQHDVDVADMTVIGLQLLSTLRSPEISLLDSSLRRRPKNEDDAQIPSRYAAGARNSVDGYPVGNWLSNAFPYTRQKQMQNWQKSQQFQPEAERFYPSVESWNAPDSNRPGTFGLQFVPENSMTSRPQNQKPSGTPTSPYWPSHASGDFDFVSGQYVDVRPRSYGETIQNFAGYRQNGKCPATKNVN